LISMLMFSPVGGSRKWPYVFKKKQYLP
jgi:hypothetical protein